MKYKMERNAAQIATNIDSVVMSTKLFSSDDTLSDFLENAKKKRGSSKEDTDYFYNSDLAFLGRMVDNIPLMYFVRVFSCVNVQESLPIFYSNDKLRNMSWAKYDDPTGWHMGYIDPLTVTVGNRQKDRLIGFVTRIRDSKEEDLGYIEAAMTMETMFPSIYESVEGEWGFFAADDGRFFTGGESREHASDILEEVSKAPSAEADLLEDNVEVFYREVGDKYCTITRYRVKPLGGYLYGVRDMTGDIVGLRRAELEYVLVMSAMMVVAGLFINQIVSRMLKRFYDNLQAIRQVQKGNLSVRANESGNDEMAELGEQLNKMLDTIDRLMKENVQREVLVKNSEIRSLQNQINAHFIYNVLESIKMMAEIDEEYELSDAITALGKMMRYSMKWVSGNVVLSDELAYIRNYLKLMNLRYDFDINLQVKIPEELMDQEIPKMSLQPVVENAVLHGIEPLSENSSIYIKGGKEGSLFWVEVTDSGRGMTAEELDGLRKAMGEGVALQGGKGTGIGLKNVEDRIRLSFGQDYGLEIFSEYGKYTKVRIKLPRRSGGSGSR